MIIKKYNTEGKYPYFIVDNWYTPEEEEKIWKELDFITQPNIMLKSTDAKSHVALDSDKKPLAKHLKIFMSELYTTEGRKYSHILQSLSKQRNEKFVEIIKDVLPDHYQSFIGCEKVNCLISYYENSDYYKSHYDTVNYTTFIWLYKKPKSFTGGNLVLTNSNDTIECVNNRLLMIPSFYQHSVTEVNQSSQSKIGYGRYSISTFWNF
jgi:Rps23 Pro-64 3,4-dihydroxylase Tpa1-like proline 4-hydroxylase